MRALYLRQVNPLAGRIGEEQPDEGVAEDGGDFGYGAVEGGVAVAHERSPWETTHDDLRLAVDPSSGGCGRRGVVPCPLTIYAGRVRVVRATVLLPPCAERFNAYREVRRRESLITEAGLGWLALVLAGLR